MLHCSLFDEKKRVQDLIEAFAICQKELPSVRIELIGDGAQRGAVQDLAQRLLRPGSFVFHGLKSKEFIADAMRKARVFVLPSAVENLPCVLIEAMACGTPVVATNVGDVDHIVREQQGILVEPRNIPELAEAIKQVLTGSKTFDYQKIAEYASLSFSREHIGRILHEEHIRAVAQSI